MNIKLLGQLKQRIVEEPLRLFMDDWLEDDDLENPERPPCGSAGCFAGNVCIITGDVQPVESEDGTGRMVFQFDCNVASTARQRLELTYEQACRLFLLRDDWGGSNFFGSVGCWPEQFQKEYGKAKGRAAKAQVAIRRIDHFIATNGKE